jgi:hypothetical protein
MDKEVFPQDIKSVSESMVYVLSKVKPVKLVQKKFS